MSSRRKTSRSVLREHMSLSDFREYYWLKDDLVAFARRLGVATKRYCHLVEEGETRAWRSQLHGAEEKGER